MKLRGLIYFFTFASTLLASNAADPVKLTGHLQERQGKIVRLELGLNISDGYRVYRDSIKLKFPGYLAMEGGLPAGEKRTDKFSGSAKEIYLRDVRWSMQLESDSKALSNQPIEVEITYRACNNMICYFPKTKRIHLSEKKPEETAAAHSHSLIE